MSHHHVPLVAARAVQTPAAAMRTYASPSGAASAQLSVWRTEMAPGTSGPWHSIDHDHVVVVLAGRLDAEIDGERVQAMPDDCVVLTAGARDGSPQATAAPSCSPPPSQAAPPRRVTRSPCSSLGPTDGPSAALELTVSRDCEVRPRTSLGHG